MEINGKWYKQEQGSVSLVFPYQLHQSRLADGMVYSAVISAENTGIFSKPLLCSLPESPIVSKDAIPNDFCALFDHAYKMYKSDNPFRREICESLLTAITG